MRIQFYLFYLIMTENLNKFYIFIFHVHIIHLNWLIYLTRKEFKDKSDVSINIDSITSTSTSHQERQF